MRYRGLIVMGGLLAVGACDDDQPSGLNKDAGILDGSTSTDGSISESDALPPGDPCQKDNECVIGTCCDCSTRRADVPLDCTDVGCASPICTGLRAKCEAGRCVVQKANCDPSTASCDVPAPQCSEEMLAEIVGGCWTGNCVPYFHCDDDCSGSFCPWRCPAIDDALLVVGASDTGDVIFSNQTDAHQYQCTVTFDQSDDDFDCNGDIAKMIATGATMLVLSGASQDCSRGTWTMQIGQNGECTFRCSDITGDSP